jgi:transposase InsO family protein
VGWSIDFKQDATLVVNAPDMAIRNRRPEPGGIVHADHGTPRLPRVEPVRFYDNGQATWCR